ncbi:hypothetical protein GLOTRDRAFT_123482 [Gloeophyllum trabeum ATCC 11539]|uniref:F-box domain-containing protein n=1 Tax=Gloeophyllum trabeum (strain ATCC 11539 / FP-39264 / Madison 617) TaxID=670483 RepID=S7R8E0_GLOTA|nr:uncharacterized protein GLOTRDRAFT_123482 [Gloeophyllum trabeum ATCC 11539]EPQ50590.1 hypothetical protein GLOTRDRAFT_123482 [Gloeophyllum trabeum ATCC 11539]
MAHAAVCTILKLARPNRVGQGYRGFAPSVLMGPTGASLIRKSQPGCSPSLPAELWLRILRIATSVPDAVAPTADDIYTPRSGRPEQRENQPLRDSLVTKRYLVRVCRLWRALASRFLYEAVVIGRGHTIPSLRDTLVASKHATESMANEYRPLGWYTRRLDLSVRGQTHITTGPAHVELDYLAEIIRCLPNLAIFTVNVTTKQYPDTMPASVMQALAENCSTSLRVLHWPDCGSRVGRVLDPKPAEWRMLLTAASNLKAVRCSDMLYSSRGYENHHSIFPDLPGLTTLTLSNKVCKDYLGSPHSLPSLRHLRYHDCSSCIPHAWKGLLQLYGAHLAAVTLIFHHFGADVQGHLDLLAEFCPRLDKLLLCFRSWPRFPAHLRLPPITCLALMSAKPNSTNAECMALFASLSTIDVQDLQTVRVMHERDVAKLRSRNSKLLDIGLAQLRCRKFQLEDHAGTILMARKE